MKIKAAVVDTKNVFPDETWFYGVLVKYVDSDSVIVATYFC